MSIVSGTVGAILGSNAQNKATKTNLRIAQETNELNRQMFQESRGQGGSAILPTYLKPGTEEAIANRAAEAVMQMFPNDPAKQMAHYQEVVDSLTPTINAGTQTIGDIYNGNLDAERQAALAPVLSARTAAADAQAQAIMEAGQEQASSIAAQDAARGYTGGGSFSNNNLLRAMVQARQQAAAQKAAAALGNAGDQRQLLEPVNTSYGNTAMDANGLFAGSEGYGQAAGAASTAAGAAEIGGEGIDYGALFSGGG